MLDGPALIYRYDGSFDGFLCCVHESVYKKEMPDSILSPIDGQLSLFGHKFIEADQEKAGRVIKSIPEKICSDALDFLQRAFMTCLKNKELDMLKFMLMGYKQGGSVMNMMTNDVVDRLAKAVRSLGGEAHLLSGFIRFSIHGEKQSEVLAAKITPKNFVLPILAPHFASRYPEQNFIIYDKTHEAVLIHQGGDIQIKFVEGFELPKADAQEEKYRRLWRMYYDTIAIEGRYNPKCRMTHMPKRYWGNMTEFAGAREI